MNYQAIIDKYYPEENELKRYCWYTVGVLPIRHWHL